MTKVFVLPVIRREDYEAFRRDVGPKFADTYDEWAKLFSGEIAEARRQGKTVVEAQVNYEEFTRYCGSHRLTPDAQILLNFAKSKPLGEA